MAGVCKCVLFTNTHIRLHKHAGQTPVYTGAQTCHDTSKMTLLPSRVKVDHLKRQEIVENKEKSQCWRYGPTDEWRHIWQYKVGNRFTAEKNAWNSIQLRVTYQIRSCKLLAEHMV